MLPILPPSETFPNAAIREFLSMLDTGQAFDETQSVRWRYAIEDGQWTVEEAMTAARWLNLNHTGYVKIAHVHSQIEEQRGLYRLARFFCWQHEIGRQVINEHLGREVDFDTAERFWQNYRHEWLNGIADKVLRQLPPAEWKKWAAENRKNFRAES
jgi:hypothetical protein